MKKVLVTGASGFLGYHVLKAFDDYHVIGVDKRPWPHEDFVCDEFIQTNVFDLEFKDLLGVDYVVHLAFITNIPNSIRHPKETTYGNIDMSVHLLELCKEAGVKMVFFPSTASLYGYNQTPWNENMTPLPIEPYSWQKLACEELFRLYSRLYNVPTVIGRFFQVYGEYQREDTALAAFMRAKLENRSITLTETTAQSTFKSGQGDFVYAGDNAQAVKTILEKGRVGEIYNVCTGELTTMEDVANAIGGKIEWIPKRPYEVETHLGDNSKLRALGWKPKTEVLQWLKDFAASAEEGSLRK